MKEDFVGYDLAVKLKEKGFKEQCLAYYSKDSDFYYNTSYGSDVGSAFKSFNSRPNLICGKRVDAPQIHEVLKWLREEKKIHVATGVTPKSLWRYVIMFCDNRGLKEPTITVMNYSSYSSAIIAGIEYVLDNLI